MRLGALRLRIAAILVLALAGCDALAPGTDQPPQRTTEPVGQYIAKTDGTADAMLLHLDELQARFMRTAEPSPAQATAATEAFRDAVIGTARAALARNDLLPHQATKATDAALLMLASKSEKDPSVIDALIEVSNSVIQNYPNTQAATNAAFVKANTLGTAPDSRYGGSLDKRLDELVPAVIELAKCEPPHAQATAMLVKLAQETENQGRFADSIKLHQMLLDKFGADEKAQDSENRIRRLEQMGRVVEDFRGKSLDGGVVDLADLRGKVVLVDFWGTWCEPCKAAMPKLKKLREKYADRGFEILGINTDPGQEIARVYVAKQQLPWPQISEPVSDEPDTLQFRFGVAYYPTYLVIDREGKLVFSTNDTSAADAEIAEMMGEAPAAKTGDDKQEADPEPIKAPAANATPGT